MSLHSDLNRVQNTGENQTTPVSVPATQQISAENSSLNPEVKPHEMNYALPMSNNVFIGILSAAIVFKKRQDNWLNARAVLDSASTKCFITNRKFDVLKMKHFSLVFKRVVHAKNKIRTEILNCYDSKTSIIFRR